MNPSQARVRVLVADDHPLFRESIVRAIKERPDFELVAEAADGREALERIRELEPDVAVIDLKMPELDGIAVIGALQRDKNPTRVVLLSAFLDGPLVLDAVAAGAAAYLSKDAERERICDAVAAVARGETVLSPEVHAGMAEQIRDRHRPERPVLTPREQQVLDLVSKGMSAPQIAEQLFLSPATVKGHLQTLYEKLGVSDRAAAVAEAMRKGLIE